MPDVEGLRIRSLDSDKPRIDQIETPHEPAVPGAVASLASLSGEQLAKMDGDEAASMIGELIDHMEGVAAEIAEDDPDMGKMLGEGAATLKRLLAEKMGEGEAPREGDEPEDEEEMEQESARILGRFRALEAGRVLSKKNLGIVREFIKALKAALSMAKRLEDAAMPRATESGVGDRALEAIEVLDADFGEFEDGKPYIKAYCVFARAGKSANVGPDGRRRAYARDAMKRLVEAGAYDNVPHYPRHLSNREVKEHPDGMRELIEGWTGPPEARPEEKAHWHEATGTARGWLYITSPTRVDQYRRDVAAGFSLKQLLKLSHDARFGSRDVRFTKAADGERVAELTNWRVASVDGATTPGLSGSGVLRQVAAYQGEGSPMSDNKTPAPGPLADRIAEIEARKTYLANAKRLIEAVTDNEDVRDKAYRFVETAEAIIDATDIEAKVAELSKPKPATPKADVHRSTESRVEAGRDRRDILRDGLIGFWDPKGYCKKDRSSEGFSSLQEFVQAGLYGAGYQGPVGPSETLNVLKASQVYDDVMDNLNRRDDKWTLVKARRSTESVLSDEERATEAYSLAESELTAYPGQFGRAQEAILTSGLGQLTGDVKHFVAQKARSFVLDRDTGALFPPLDLVVTRTETRDTINETQRFGRVQKLGANEAAAVAEGAAYANTVVFTDEEESGTVPDKYGFTSEISIETLANSQGFQLIQMLPTMHGEACGWREYVLGYNILLSNPNLADGTAIVAAGRSNHVATAISYANVSTLQSGMRQVVEYSTGTGNLRQHAGIQAKHLVCADEIYNTALELFSHESDPRTGNRAASAIVNPGNPPLSIWSLPLLDNAATPNTDDYFLLGDAQQHEMQVRVVWSGQPTPQVFVADRDDVGGSVKWSNDLVAHKSRMFIGFVPTDLRAVAGVIVP